jgi:Flp pilus assembly protein TadG
LLTIVFAIFQFGIAFHQYIELTDAVRAGARVAAVSATAADPVGASKAAVQSSASDLSLDPNAITVTSDWQSGHTVTVYAAFPYTISIFGIPVHSGSMTSSTTERVE